MQVLKSEHSKINKWRTVCCLCAALVLSACSQENGPLEPTVISVPEIGALGPYSTAVKANGMLYVSGIIAYDSAAKQFAPPNIDAQTKQVFANLLMILAASESSLDDIVKVNVYLKDAQDMPAMNKTYATYFSDYFPARTTVPNANWGNDNILIEIDVIALLKDN